MLHYKTLINKVNEWGQFTRPKKVGPQAPLVREYEKLHPNGDADSFMEWQKRKNPQLIAYLNSIPKSKSLRRILDQMQADLLAIPSEIATYAEGIIKSTYEGVRTQDHILKAEAERRGVKLRLASEDEEKRDIDGWLGNESVSVKPNTWRGSAGGAMNADILLIYTRNKKTGELSWKER